MTACAALQVAVHPQLLAEGFGAGLPADVVPRFNVAPTDPVLAVTRRDDERELLVARWGLVPHWRRMRRSAPG